MRQRRSVVGAVAVAVAVGLAIGAAAQAPPAAQGFKRTPVQQGDSTIPGREFVQVVAEISSGAESGRHTHPGDEIGYVADGTIALEVQGKAMVMKKAGEGFFIPAGTVHNARNTSTAGARVLATYIIEKGKPVATPVP